MLFYFAKKSILKCQLNIILSALEKYKDLPLVSVSAPFKAGSGADNYVDVKAGGLAIRDLANLYKFDNTVTVIKLTGADVKEWLEFSANMYNTIDPNSTEEQDLINRDFPTFNYDVIDGVEYEIDVTKEPRYDKNGTLINENTSRIYNLTYNGKPLDLKQEFLIATNNYRAGGNSFPWQGRQEIVYSSTDETRDVLKNHIEAAGKYEPTIDNNWKFKAIDTEAKVFFTSHEDGVNYLDENSAISTEKEVAGTKLYKYDYDLAYGLTTDEEAPGQPEMPEVPSEEAPELPEIQGDTEEDKTEGDNQEKPENSKPENKPSSPQTGDASMIGYAAMGIGAVAGLFAIRRRK